MTESITYVLANAAAENQPVIYVTDKPAMNELGFTLTFQGNSAITLRGGPPVAEDKITPAGPTSFYFTVSAVLTPQEFAAMTVTVPKGWQAKNLTSWVLTPVDDLIVQPGDSFTFKLGNITADGTPGPGSFNIDSYNTPGLPDTGTQLSLALDMPPNTHKRLADDLKISFSGGDNVYIDIGNAGRIPSNTLILRLDNTSSGPIVPPGTPWPNTPVFYLSFVSADAPPGYGALTTTDRLKNIVPSLAKDYGTRWSIQDHSNQHPPYWAIYPKSPEILGTGASAIVEFRIADIVTDFAPSATNLYLQSSFIPGYDDGCQAIPINKIPPKLAIEDFRSDTNNVPSGTEVALSWQTFDADRCELSPVNGGSVKVPIQSAGSYKIKVDRTTNFTLTAFNDRQGTRTSAPRTVDVQPVRFTKQLTSTPASGSHFGQPVTLSWETVSAQSCTISPPINGSSTVPVCSTDTVIYPAGTVQYLLTAQGQDGPVTSSLNVIPIPNGWVKRPYAGPWTSLGRPVMLAGFKDCIWFLAGGAEDLQSAVFRSIDGFAWEYATNNAGFSPRGDAAGCIHNGKMWLLGGSTRTGAVDEIWASADGVNWSQVQAKAHWSPRSQLGCVSYAGKIWVIGGSDAQGAPLGDVWNSTDGITWNQITPAAIWPARAAAGVCVFDGAICIIAGRSANGPLADAWQSNDGQSWSGLGDTITWLPRSSPTANVANDTLYLIGGIGRDGKMIADSNILSPGGSWNMGLGPSWPADTAKIGSTSFLGALWFAGGTINGVTNQTVWGFGG